MYVLALPRSSIGKKVLMAISGVIWIGYLALHMWGNLHFFQGQEAFNHYAEFLREVGDPVFTYAQVLWVIRVVILAAIAVHIWAAAMLFRQAQQARSTNYAVKRVLQVNYATRFMRIGGVVILFFVIFHLAQFTWGWVTQFDSSDPYTNLIAGFSNPLIVFLYLVALAALALHLFHGVWSMFQTLGWNNRDWDGFYRGLAIFVAVVIPLGFAVVPLSIAFNLV